MSDIAIGPKLGVMLGGLFALALGVVLLLGAATIGAVLLRGHSWQVRIFRFSAGPLACIASAIVFLIVAQFLEKSALWWLDAHLRSLPLVGLVVAIVTTVATEVHRLRR